MQEQILIAGHLHKLFLLQAQLMRLQVAPMNVLVKKMTKLIANVQKIALILKPKGE